MWELSIHWYGDRLRADSRPPSREHLTSLLRQVGLTDPFFALS